MTGGEFDAPPWPDDDPRECSDCGRERHDVRLRINLARPRLLCGPCFEGVPVQRHR